MGIEFVNTRQTAELLGKPLQYGAVLHLIKRGFLNRIEVSPRNMFYKRANVQRIAASMAKFEKRA